MSVVAPPRARVLRWSAWAVGRETREAWQSWARTPEPLTENGCPDARFLPAMLRRRCTPLSRIVLSTAFDCLEEGERESVRTVFASRHGSLNESIDLLSGIARGERVSPTKFSHTVHNAQAGLFCIAAGNRQASSSLAACADTFACGWVEALAHLERDPDGRVLYVIGDVALAPTFADLVPERPTAYGLALLMGRHGGGPELALSIGEAPVAVTRGWPDALEFLRWLLVGEPALALGRFHFARA